MHLSTSWEVGGEEAELRACLPCPHGSPAPHLEISKYRKCVSMLHKHILTNVYQLKFLLRRHPL